MATSKDPAQPVRRGRPPGGGSSRRRILDAARNRFGSEGFAATTIRAVASDAGVDASQVMQFFGSKAELFAAVVDIPASAMQRFDAAFEGPADQLGERVVRAYLQAWEEIPAEAEPLMVMLRSAITHDQAREQLRDFIQSRLLRGQPVAPGDPAALRAGLAASMLVGLILGRRIVEVPALVEADPETLVRTVGPAIQQLLAADDE